MPIYFTVNKSEGYYVSTYVGVIDDSVMVESYRQFLEGDEWVPGLNELVDLSSSEMVKVTSDGLRAVARLASEHYGIHGLRNVQTTIYAPENLHYGIGRMYDALADSNPEEVQVFRNRSEAESWLKKHGP